MGKRTQRRVDAVRLRGLAIDKYGPEKTPFRDKEAQYEAQYLARLAERTGAVAREDSVVTQMACSKVRKEIAKYLEKGPKKKCCKSSPRCMRCPVVLKKLGAMDTAELDDKALKKALKNIRAA